MIKLFALMIGITIALIVLGIIIGLDENKNDRTGGNKK